MEDIVGCDKSVVALFPDTNYLSDGLGRIDGNPRGNKAGEVVCGPNRFQWALRHDYTTVSVRHRTSGGDCATHLRRLTAASLARFKATMLTVVRFYSLMMSSKVFR